MAFWKKFLSIAAPIGAMFIPGVGPAIGGALKGALGAAANPSVWSKVASIGKNYGGVIGAAGAALGAGAQASAQNRDAQLAAMMDLAQVRADVERDYNAALVSREQEGRASATDAWRKLQQAQYVQSATGATPGFSPYSKAIAAPTDVERQGAKALEAEVMRRLVGGNAIPMPTRPELPTGIPGPSVWERIAGIAGPGLATLGMYDRLRSNDPYDPRRTS